MVGSMSRAPMSAATSATSPARITAPSGQYNQVPTGPVSATAPRDTMVAPDGNNVARRSTVDKGPNQSAASLTSPPSDTHSASAPAGTRSCGIPGATLAPEAGTS